MLSQVYYAKLQQKPDFVSVLQTKVGGVRLILPYKYLQLLRFGACAIGLLSVFEDVARLTFEYLTNRFEG